MEITENKLKEILTEQRTEFQHIVGIFKEDLESKDQSHCRAIPGYQSDAENAH